MKKQLKNVLAVMLVFGVAAVQAQTAKSTATNSTAKKATVAAQKKESPIERQLRELREQMASQQSQMVDQQNQINNLKQQLADRDARLATAASDAQAASAAAATAASQVQSVSSSVQQNNEAVATLNDAVTGLKSTNVVLVKSLSDTKKSIDAAMASPVALRYKGLTITPGGFFAFDGIWHSRSLASDLSTAFNATPYTGAAMAHVSELNFSARKSRLSALFQGDTGPFKVSGYVETDFMASGTNSNNNQTNSYPLRVRQAWSQAAMKSGFTVTAGQMWTLTTVNKKSTDANAENLPKLINSTQHVGFSWGRQPGVRLQQKFGKLTGAFSLENAQTIYSASNAPSNFFFGSAGNNSGAYNTGANYSNNVAPDFIVKAAYDAKYAHLELGGLARWFRDRVYPQEWNGTAYTISASGASNDTKTGGGFFANIYGSPSKYMDAGVHILTGTGVGRYGATGLPDVTVHPDGTLAPVKFSQGMLSLEGHPTKSWDISGYAGAEYAQRTTYKDPNSGTLVGYAPSNANNSKCGVEVAPTTNTGYAPGAASCTGTTRAIIEGTFSIFYRPLNSTKFGRMQYGLQYSYLTRMGWSGTGGLTAGAAGIGPKATNNMIFTSIRYFIP